MRKTECTSSQKAAFHDLGEQFVHNMTQSELTWAADCGVYLVLFSFNATACPLVTTRACVRTAWHVHPCLSLNPLQTVADCMHGLLQKCRTV